MKALVQNYLGYATYNPTQQLALLYYMSGAVPTTPAQVKAIVDLSDTSDLHSKCSGVSLITSNYSLDTSGVGKVSVSYTPNLNNGITWSWLKGGALNSGSWYFLPPSRYYYEDGRKANLYNLPPVVFTMPVSAIYGSNILNYNNGMHFSNVGAQSTSVILEYDNPTTVSAFRFGHGDPWYASSNPMVQAARIYYWDSATSAYVLAYNYDPGTTYSESATVHGFTFTAVTSTKFKVVLYGYRDSSALQYCFAVSGVCLMHSSAPAPVAAPDITWGVIVPFQVGVGTTSTIACGLCDIDTTNAVYRNNATDLSQNYDVTNNLNTGRSAMWYGIAAKNMPAIIDSCGQDSVSNKIVITKSTNLTSIDQPLLSTYKYLAGDFL